MTQPHKGSNNLVKEKTRRIMDGGKLVRQEKLNRLLIRIEPPDLGHKASHLVMRIKQPPIHVGPAVMVGQKSRIHLQRMNLNTS